MHISPTSLTCALTIIRDADLSELPDIKESIATSLLSDISKCKRRKPTGNIILDEVRSWVDEYRIKITSADRLRMIEKIVSRQQRGDKPIAGGINEEMIERAREVPIQNMLDTQIFKSTGKWIGCTYCPLPDHKGERTPSFFIDKNNKWKCFGCQAFGDAIELHMKLNGMKFIQAIKSLQ